MFSIIHKVFEWFANFHRVKRPHSTTSMNRLQKKHKIRIIKSIINI